MASDLNRAIMRNTLYFCGRFDIEKGPPVHRSATSIVVIAKDFDVVKDYRSVFAYITEDDSTFAGLKKEGIKQALHRLDEIGYYKAFEILSEAELQDKDTSRSRDSIFDHFGSSCKTEEDFVERCKVAFGEYRKVAIKFMKDEAQCSKEMNMRQLSDSESLESKYVIGLLECPDGDVFAKAVEKITIGGNEAKIDLKEYKYGIIMPAADRSLETIYRSERPDMAHVKLMMKEVAEDVQYCHENGIIHCDLKMANIIRVNGRMKLTDFDAACKIGPSENPADNFAGGKFSSGVLPPEMFHNLKGTDAEKLKAYWDCESSKVDTELRNKVKPKKSVQGPSYCVKTFLAATASATETLPYHRVRASPQFDMWSFGIILYTLCVGDFMLLSRDGDIIKSTDMKKVAHWSESEFNKLEGLSNLDSVVTDLLRKLLQEDPNKRPSTMQEILGHPFFLPPTPSVEGESMILKKMDEYHQEQKKEMAIIRRVVTRIEERTINLSNIASKSLYQIRKTERVLLRGLIEVGDVNMPSTFIIVNQRLQPPLMEPITSIPLLDTAATSILDEEIAESESAKLSLKFLNALGAVGKAVTAGVTALNDGDILKAVNNLLVEKNLFLYLVDERTMMPVVIEKDTVYPIVITTSREFVHKVLPLMKIGLKAVAVVNGLSGIARLLGYPLPSIPQEYMDTAKKAVGSLSKESSVAEFDVLQQRLDGLKSDTSDKLPQEMTRGSSLREFFRFLRENDSNCTFSGLQRVLTPEGACCWTTENGAAEMAEEGRNEITQWETELSQDFPAVAVSAKGNDDPVPFCSILSEVDAEKDVEITKCVGQLIKLYSKSSGDSSLSCTPLRRSRKSKCDVEQIEIKIKAIMVAEVESTLVSSCVDVNLCISPFPATVSAPRAELKSSRMNNDMEGTTEVKGIPDDISPVQLITIDLLQAVEGIGQMAQTTTNTSVIISMPQAELNSSLIMSGIGIATDVKEITDVLFVMKDISFDTKPIPGITTELLHSGERQTDMMKNVTGSSKKKPSIPPRSNPSKANCTTM